MFKKKLLFRPDEEEIRRHSLFVHSVFEDFVNFTTVIDEYLRRDADGKAQLFRNKQGGNILFRPIVFPIYFDVALMIAKAKKIDIKSAFCILNNSPQTLRERPWFGLLWDGSKINNRTSHTLIKNMLLYMTCSSILSHAALNNFVESYAKTLTIDTERAMTLLEPFKDCSVM